MENKIEDKPLQNNLKSKIEQILPDYITSDIILKPALCIKIPNKDTSALLSKLKKNNLSIDKIYLKDINYHTKNMDKDYQRPIKEEETSKFKEYEGSFLKRVKKYNNKENLVLISFIDDLEYKKITKEKILKDYSLKESDLVEVNIPCTESISNEQYYKNNKIWPQCNYISTKEKYIHIHNKEEEKEILDIYNQNFLINNIDNITSLLYDPKTKIILAKANKNEKSIIGHSIMNLLDVFSQMLVNNKIKNKHEEKKKEKKEEEEEEEEEKKDKESDDKRNNRKLGEKCKVGPKETNEFILNFNGDNKDDNYNQYYCEGLYVFTKDEPCLMCAMALVHNRISRLYFSDINEKDGALVSRYSLDNYDLNHHYLIFKLN